MDEQEGDLSSIAGNEVNEVKISKQKELAQLKYERKMLLNYLDSLSRRFDTLLHSKNRNPIIGYPNRFIQIYYCLRVINRLRWKVGKIH
jgi:hypothetical protein